MPTDLPERQQQIYDALKGRGDVPITELCTAISAPPLDLTRNHQQWLGPYITRLNRRLAKQKLRVKPGALKGTYRLTVV